MEETTVTQKKGGMNPIIIAVVVVIVLAGLGYMMMKSNSSSTETMSPSPTEAMKADDGAAMQEATKAPDAMAKTDTATTDATTADVKVVNIEAGSFYYKPNVITVKKGQKVKIVMKAVSMMHDFNIDELNVKMETVKNGDTGTVEFTADKVGTFEYYCSVGQHRKMGQVGKLIVE